MIHSIRCKFLTLVLLPIVSMAACAQVPASHIDAIFSRFTSALEPGCAVLVIKDGKTVFRRGYGITDLRSLHAIGPETNFRLASLTKQFTATAIMLLVHDGKLRYDDRLSDVFPGFPPYGKGITIRRLLNHTSGLVDYEDLMEKQYVGVPAEQIPQIKDVGVFELLKHQAQTKFPPGTRWDYSNSGYVILAMVVEKKSGMSFGDFLQERIFKPLKMNRTIAYENGKNEIANRAYGHTHNGGGWRETDQSSTSATLGDGGIYTSLDDLEKWDRALTRHVLLTEKEMAPALAPPVARSAAPLQNPDGTLAPGYGFGWFLDTHRGHRRYAQLVVSVAQVTRLRLCSPSFRAVGHLT